MIELAILAGFGVAVLLFMVWVYYALQDWTEDDYMPPEKDDSHTWHQHAEHTSAVERAKSITRGD